MGRCLPFGWTVLNRGIGIQPLSAKRWSISALVMSSLARPASRSSMHCWKRNAWASGSTRSCSKVQMASFAPAS
eukprot:1238203-Lingulodinium_polyedra.AAC.1